MCVLTQMSGTLRALSSGAPAWTSPGSCKQTRWDMGSERVTSEIQTSEKCTLRESGEGWDAGATPRIPHVLFCLCSHGLSSWWKLCQCRGRWQQEFEGYLPTRRARPKQTVTCSRRAGPGRSYSLFQQFIHDFFSLCWAKLQPKQLRREITTWVKFWN